MSDSIKINKAIFFDRDGVVNYRQAGVYLSKPEDFKIIPDFFPFFTTIKNSSYLAILVTNQQGIGKGLMTEKELYEVHQYMQTLIFESTGFMFDDIYYCPELKETNSPRRKPNPGMLLEAIEKWNIDTENSWMIGDRKSDSIAGKRAGLQTIQLTPMLKKKIDETDYYLTNLILAQRLIKLK